KEKWGQAFDANHELAERAFETGWPDDFNAVANIPMPDGSLLGDNAIFVLGMYELGSRMAEGALIDPASIHESLIESIIEVDEGVTERYFEGKLPTDEEIARLIGESIAAGSLIPVLCVSAKTGVGLTELFDALQRRGGKLLTQRFRIDQLLQVLADRCCISWFDKHSGIADHFRATAGRAGYDRHPSRHRLQHRNVKDLRTRREHQHLGRGEYLRYVAAQAKGANHPGEPKRLDSPQHFRSVRPATDQQQTQGPAPRKKFLRSGQKSIEILVGHDVRNVDQDRTFSALRPDIRGRGAGEEEEETGEQAARRRRPAHGAVDQVRRSAGDHAPGRRVGRERDPRRRSEGGRRRDHMPAGRHARGRR
ncbi:hypothetical protein LCGC14_2577760, partial [marine sediment metagenome]